MRLYTLDGTVLMDIKSIELASLKSGGAGLLIDGKIMGAMPMKAVVSPEELRAGIRLLSWKVVARAIAMLVWPRRELG